MSENIQTHVRSILASALANVFASGKMVLYTGSAPASADVSATGTLLVSIILPSPAFTVVSGVATKSGTWAATAVASGTFGWFRLENHDGSRRVDGEIGELTLDNTSIVSGGLVTIDTYTLTQPAA